MNDIKLNTGYNPNSSNFIGTADEKPYVELTVSDYSLATIIKDANIVIDEPIYPVEDLYLV